MHGVYEKLVPWDVKPEHITHHYVRMLRAESRLRAGFEVGESDMISLDVFRRHFMKEGTVVHYDPDSEIGFTLVPRRQGADRDFIREPEEGE